MLGSKTDKKNIELSKLLYQLREDIDVERIIGLNVIALRESEISNALVGYLQKTAQESLALYFCKIFELPDGHSLNSIPGIISSIPETPLSGDHATAFLGFGRKYGNKANPSQAKSYLNKTFNQFRKSHSLSLKLLKNFRDTVGAHSDSDSNSKLLPSHDECEKLYTFAVEFYNLVARYVINSGPATIPRGASSGLVRLMKSMGIQNPKTDFDVNE
jgi:AbiU2